MEEIKNSWRDAKFNVNEKELELIMFKRRATSLERLKTRYKRFSNIAFLMIFWCPLFAFTEPAIPFKPYLALAFGLFFVTVSMMDRWLYMGVSSIDCATMAVSEVARRAVFYRKRHFQFQIILIPYAIALVGAMIYLSSDNPGFIYGIIFGILVGGCVGWFQFLKFMRDYKILRSALILLPLTLMC